MARRSSPAQPNTKHNRSKDAPAAKKQAEAPTLPPGELPPVSWKLIGSILGGFAAVSLLYVLLAWPGYQLNRHTRLAERAVAQEKYADAVPHLQSIVQRYPKAWMRYRQLGDCYLELEKPEEALEAYRASLKEAPKQDLNARLGRAFYLKDKGSKEAIGFLQKAFDKDQNDSEVNYYMGLFYMNQREYAKAAARFQAAAGDPKFREKSKPELEIIRKALLGS